MRPFNKELKTKLLGIWLLMAEQKLNEVFVTSDNNLFALEHGAKNHCQREHGKIRKTPLKYEKVTWDEVRNLKEQETADLSKPDTENKEDTGLDVEENPVEKPESKKNNKRN